MKKIILLLCIFTFPVVSFSQTPATPAINKNVALPEHKVTNFKDLPGNLLNDENSPNKLQKMSNMKIMDIATYDDTRKSKFFYIWLKDNTNHPPVRINVGSTEEPLDINLMSKLIYMAYSLGQTIDVIVEDTSKGIQLRVLEINNNQYEK